MAQQHESKLYKTDLIRITTGAGGIFVGKIIDSALRYLYVLILARALGAKLFGILLLGLVIVGFATIISRLGLDNGAVRYISIYIAERDNGRIKATILEALTWSFVMGTLIGAGLFVCSPFLSLKVFEKPELQLAIRFLSFSLPFSAALGVALSCTRGLQTVKYAVFGRLIFGSLSNIVLALIFSAAGFGLGGLAIANTTSVVLTFTLSMYFVFKCFSYTRYTQAIYETKKLFRFSIPSSGTVFLSAIIMWTDILMLGYFRTSEEVGIYSAANKTALFVGLGMLCFGPIFEPIVADICNKSQFHKLETLLKTITRWIFTIAFPVFMLIVVLSKQIMMMFGEDYMAGYIPLIILASAHLINVSMGFVGIILTMSGKQDLMLCNHIIVCLLNVFLNRAFIPSYGIIGASLASAISITVSNIVMLLEVLILLRIHPYNLQFLKSVISGIVAFGVLLLVYHIGGDLNSVLRILISVLVFTTVFLWLLYKFGFNSEDKFVFRFIKKKIVN